MCAIQVNNAIGFINGEYRGMFQMLDPVNYL
jgi:hypothetical protein